MPDNIVDTAVNLWGTLRECELTIDCRLIRIRLNKIHGGLTKSQKEEYWEKTNAIIAG